MSQTLRARKPAKQPNDLLGGAEEDDFSIDRSKNKVKTKKNDFYVTLFQWAISKSMCEI
jgi:hypothetical protein